MSSSRPASRSTWCSSRSAGTEAANTAFGVDISLLREANAAGRELHRGTVGNNVMYMETGQGSALSAGAHLGTGGRPVDQQTLEARAYAVARDLDPLLVNTVVGFIGPEYLYDGKQIIRAGLEDHFCGKLLGLPMGVDVCYTNHAEADQDDMDTLLTLLGAAGAPFVIAVPGADDVMLGYQSLSFHDVLYVRQVLGLRPAPEFETGCRSLGWSTARAGCCRSMRRRRPCGSSTAHHDRRQSGPEAPAAQDFWAALRLTTSPGSVSGARATAAPPGTCWS